MVAHRQRRYSQATMVVVLRAVLFGALCVGSLFFPRQARALSEAELCQRYLGIVEDAVTVFEPLWVDQSDRIPNSGFFDFSQYDDWKPKWYPAEITVPGNGMVIFCYSVLLTATDKQTFTDKHVPRATLLDHAVKAIRWCCLTSAYVDHPYPFPIKDGYPRRIKDGYWVRPLGHRTDVMGWLTVGAARLWHLLDEETRTLLGSVMTGTASKERLSRTWEYPQGGNHDVVKQDLASVIGAAYLCPDHPDAGRYMDFVRAVGIDLVSTRHDRAAATVAEGKPVREWASGWNLYQDYSSDHHGWAQVWYGGDMLFEGRHYVSLMSGVTGLGVPETWTYEGNGFDGVLEYLKALCLPEGEPASLHGMEYDAYYGAGLLGYAYGACVTKDRVSAALEERAASLLERHSRAVRVYDYHRNTWAKAAAAFLMHQHAGPRAEPLAFDQAWQALNGTYHYRWQQTLLHRSASRWASFSWGSISDPAKARPCGFVVPTRGLGPQPDPLIYLHRHSLAGEFTVEDGERPSVRPSPDSFYRFSRDDGGFHTAGRVVDPSLERYYAFWSFADGPCVIWHTGRARRPLRLSWSGMPVYFYVRPGITTSRRYYDAQGVCPLEEPARRTSSWWCVDDAIGVALAGDSGCVDIKRCVGNNWARTDKYKDKCDGVFVSAVSDLRLEAGDTACELAAAIYTDTPHLRVAKAAEQLGQNPLSLPAGWKGLVAPDAFCQGKRYLALANIHGIQTHANLELSFPEGAPVLSHEVLVVGARGFVTLSLGGLETYGQAIELYAETPSDEPVLARKDAPNRYLFRPVGRASVKLRYRGPSVDAFVIRPAEGTKERIIQAKTLDADRSFVVELDGPSSVEVRGPADLDQTGPAVELSDMALREDGQVTAEVTARDRSGIRDVTLYCDGKPVGRKSVSPYVWVSRPGEGAHTFHAVAVDASPGANSRKSFKRTLDVSKRR